MEERPFVDTLKGMRISGRYVVEKILGAGGMGVVALARYPELQQKVAIKFLYPEHAANGVLNQRFVREGRIAAQVKSEHFVRVFDIGRLPTGVPYLVMELLTGRDLGDIVVVDGPLPVERAVDYMLQAAVGLAEVHALGVVHRDLKPSNLFVAEIGGKKVIKVLDFGISKENVKRAASLTATDNLLGTPQYMSPEQVRASKDVDARSDIWSLGVILYEILAARRPFTSEENAVGELFAKVMYIDPPPLTDFRSDLPEGLEAVVRRCMSRELAGRYATVAEFAEALRPFAPAASLHRIEAVQQALAARRSLLPPSVQPTPAGEAETRISGSMRDPSVEVALASTSAPEVDGDVTDRSKPAGPITSLTSSQASASRDLPRARWRSLLIGAVGIAVGAGLFALGARGKPEIAPLPATASSSPSTSTASSAIEAPPPVEMTPQAPPPVEMTPQAPPTGAASIVEAPPSMKPIVRPSSKPHASIAPAVSAPPKQAGTADLIQDRK